MCDVLHVTSGIQEIETKLSEKSPDKLEAAEPSLLNLPVEIFIKICTFLDANFVSETVSKVCKRFEDILADSELWRHWVYCRVRGDYPPLPELKIWDELELNWEQACIDMDREYKKWTNSKTNLQHIVVKDVHFASVDTVLLARNGELAISGGRDRSIALWNVESVYSHDKVNAPTKFSDAKPEKMRRDAHVGWVWDLAADCPENATIVYSASWDNTVKAWDLETGLTCVETFGCGMSALSVVTSENIVYAGLYSKKVIAFDIRVGPKKIHSYQAHKGPILSLEHFENKIASVSEDKTLAVWDRKAGKTLAIDVKIQSEKAYPVRTSWSPSALYVGDSRGALHLLDPEQFTYVRSHEMWPEQPDTKPSCKITGCYQNLGCLILCCDRGEVKFCYNSFPPQEYTNISASTLEVTKLAYQNDVLVLGTCESALEFWIPVDKYQAL